jgi:hypothetical protein
MKGLFLLKSSINHNFFWVILFSFFVIIEGNAFPQMSFHVSPPLLEINQVSGGVRNFYIEISNTGPDKIQIKTSYSDLSLSSDGKVEINNPGGSTPFSLAPWITTKLEEITFLEPGDTRKILFQLSVPRGERGGRYGVIVFEALPFSIPHGKVSMGIRSGTLIFLTIPRTEEIKGTIEEIVTTSNGKEFKLIFKNTGNIHYEIEGNIIIKNNDGKILHRIRFSEKKPSLLLPQGKREFVILWDKRDPLPEGNYTVEARISARVGNRMLNVDRKETFLNVKIDENETIKK